MAKVSSSFDRIFKLVSTLGAKDSILGISKKTGISRSNLYAIFSGEQQPQLSTALKIIKELGYTVQVA